MLIEEDAIEQRDGGWFATERLRDVPLPDSVHGVIAARVDLLDAPVRDALRRCSVMGRTFWPAAVHVEEELVEALAQRGLVSERPSSVVAGMREFVFKHALTRDVAYQSLPREGASRRFTGRSREWIESFGAAREGRDGRARRLSLPRGDRLRGRTIRRSPPTRSSSCSTPATPRSPGPRSASAASLFERAAVLAFDDRARYAALVALARCDIAERRYETGTERLLEARGVRPRSRRPSARSRGAGLADARLLARRPLGRGDGERERGNRSAGRAARVAGRSRAPSHAAPSSRCSEGSLMPRPTRRRRSRLRCGVGDAFAEVNGRINLFTARRGARGFGPTRDDVLAVLAQAAEQRLWDEAYRLVVNYLWSASPHEPIPDAPRCRRGRARAARRRAQRRVRLLRRSTSALSRVKFLWVPSGDWDEVDTELEAAAVTVEPKAAIWLVGARSRPAWRCAAATSTPSTRRLPEWIDRARREHASRSASSRWCPWYLPRAALAGDLATIRSLTETVLGTFDDRQQWAPLASAAIPRALFAAGEHDLLCAGRRGARRRRRPRRGTRSAVSLTCARPPGAGGGTRGRGGCAAAGGRRARAGARRAVQRRLRRARSGPRAARPRGQRSAAATRRRARRGPRPARLRPSGLIRSRSPRPRSARPSPATGICSHGETA